MLDVVILAAGGGTRMKSRRPKVLHGMCGRPLLQWVIEAAQALLRAPPLVVVGPENAAVRKQFAQQARFCVQPRRLGTGDALRQAVPYLLPDADQVLVLYGDMPLLQTTTLQRLVHCEAEPNCTGPALLTISRPEPQGFGRIVRNGQGEFQGIIEERDCTPQQLGISELNVGVYVFEVGWLRNKIDKLEPHTNEEFYLTDLPGLAKAEGKQVHTVETSAEEASGVNTRVQLAEAERLMRDRINSSHMNSGVTLNDPNTTYIDAGVVIGTDTTIGPGVLLTGNTVVGQDCEIGAGTQLHDTEVQDGSCIRHSVLEGTIIGKGCHVGPFARMRPGTHLGCSVHVGSFGEIKNSKLDRNVIMGHFSYVGDSDIGANVNVGAGTITCNFDGETKHRTVVEEGAFLGSGTKLVAPVKVGRGARTGAGSVITRDVPANSLVYGVPARPQERGSKKPVFKGREGK